MLNNTFHVFSASVDTYLYVQKNCGTHFRALVSDGTGTNSTPCALISAASSLLLGAFLILLPRTVLYYVVQYATNWHGRFFRLFLIVLGPNSVDRTCPGRDSGSTSSRQSGPISSRVSVQPSSALTPAGGRPRNNGGKRPGDDDSDAEDNDRDKRRRLKAPDESKLRVRCPFKDHDPENPEFEQCGSFDEWSRLREHLLARKHRPRERCPTCGETFDDADKWDEHTGVERSCQPSSQQLERPSWVDKNQAAKIKALSSKGRRTEGSLEEMHRKVCKILFGYELAPARTASGHPTFYPHSQHTGEFEQNDRPQESWNSLIWRIGDLPGMQEAPRATILQIIQLVCQDLNNPKEQNHVFQSQEPVAREAAVEENVGNDEANIAGSMQPAATSEGQIPLITEAQWYAAGPSDGYLEPRSTYVFEGASSSFPVPSDLGGAHAVLPDHLSGHFTAFTPSSGTTQVSDVALMRPFCDQSLDGTNYFTNVGDEMLDSLDKLDYGGSGFCLDVAPMQPLFGGGAPDEDEGRIDPGFTGT